MDFYVDPQLQFINDGAYFHLSGYKLLLIMRDKSDHAIHDIPLYNFKIAMWCVASSKRITGPVSCQETVNSDR
jgi:hypothetical protein